MRLISTLLLLCSAALAQQRSPNIILIFCDDLGYGDIGCFGSKVHRTPNIDSLGEAGMRLTHFYSTSGVCTPSRSSLMTGSYPRRVNMHQSANGEWVLFPVARKGLNPGEVTIAEVMKGAGYATACVGKWHLGDQLSFLPTRQGFDSYFGIPYSNDMGSKQRKVNPPLPLLRDETVIEAPVDQTTVTRRYTEAAIEFIKRNRETPFFLYLPHTMPHNPVNSSEAFAGKSANGGYGDCVEEIDWSTGQIMAAVEQSGLTRDTIIIFTSDNGAASRWGGSNAPLRGHKGSTWDGGMRVPCVIRWPGVIPAGSTSSGLSSTVDLLPTLAGFAKASLSTNKIDGVDLGSMLRRGQDAASPREAFYFFFKDQLQAVRAGKWKLHLPRTEKKRRAKKETKVPLRLYDMIADQGESKNVAPENADVVARLLKLAETARADLGDRGRSGDGQRPAGIMEDPRGLR